MIEKVHLENYGPLKSVSWEPLGRINLVIGCNGTGKTFLLKALYSAMRTLEAYRRGNEPRSASEILREKLYWTFQPDKIGDLVTRGADSNLKLKIGLDGKEFHYGFGRETAKQIPAPEITVTPRSSNSIFLPAKEVLSLHQIILESREKESLFGFDDTYYDLAKALAIRPQRGKNFREFSDARKSLEDMFGGKIEYQESAGEWIFKKGNQRFPMGVTAEGIKKIAILETLLVNRFLDLDSVIFIDEPEAALHPSALITLLDIVATLAERGIQFFIASHSYFVVKKLYLIAQEKKMSIPVLRADGDHWEYDDLLEGIPDNEIINESISLHEEEVDLVF